MLSTGPNTAGLLRKKAERYRRLAENLTDQKDRQTVMAYCCALLDRADRLEEPLKEPLATRTDLLG